MPRQSLLGVKCSVCSVQSLGIRLRKRDLPSMIWLVWSTRIQYNRVTHLPSMGHNSMIYIVTVFLLLIFYIFFLTSHLDKGSVLNCRMLVSLFRIWRQFNSFAVLSENSLTRCMPAKKSAASANTYSIVTTFTGILIIYSTVTTEIDIFFLAPFFHGFLAPLRHTTGQTEK